MTLRRRLARLEARAAGALGPVEVTHWMVAPGLDGPRLCGVLRLSDGLRLDRAAGEAEGAFRVRAEAALAAGAAWPDHDATPWQPLPLAEPCGCE